MMNNVQGDCRCGSLGFPAGEDLTLATGKLAKLNADGHVVSPAANTDITPYVITCGADQGYLCGVTPLNSLSNSRVILKGTCQAGQLLVAVGDGRVEAGTLSGTAIPVGVAEEDGVEGQHVLLRPLCVGARGPAGTDGEDGADGADGGVFRLAVGNVSFSGEASALVGKCVAYEAGGWNGIFPPVNPALGFALVTGVAEGVFTCVFLGFAEQSAYPASVPTAMVTGGGSVGNVVFIDSGPDNTSVLGIGTNLYSGETWTVLAVAGWTTFLKKSYSAL